MAAVLESPLVSSPQNIMLALSPYTEFSLSPCSPARSPFKFMSARNSSGSHIASLNQTTFESGLSPMPQVTSPSDVGPSPVTSTETETTEINDEEVLEQSNSLPHTGSGESLSSSSTLKIIDTSIPQRLRLNSDDESTSAIHAPAGYGSFANTKNTNPPPPRLPPIADRLTPTPYEDSEDKKTPTALDMTSLDKDTYRGPISPPPISTDIAPMKFGLDTATPRAQTRQEIDAFTGEKSNLRTNAHSSSGSLEGIPEDQAEAELGDDDFDTRTVQNAGETNALKTALHECWTLCNTLASLSSIHRERIFSSAGKGDVHEQAWKCCWKLCQELYNSRDEEPDFEVRPTLDLCRDFCQALFDVRMRDNEVADSVLRVSFELNNHLYNTHDRNLPEAFRERTLDFYITLCHRLMKQRSGLGEETDSLLRACWSLAEMLFSLRQNRRKGKAADEELLGSAVQACWELCDLFREGWTQVRPERGTPRPSQTTFTQAFDQLSRSTTYQPINSKSNTSTLTSSRPTEKSGSGSGSGSGPGSGSDPRPSLPETPTTEFEDTPASPEDTSPLIPNILILGTESNSRSTKNRWSSAASSLSQYSQGSTKSTTSTATAITTTSPENPNLTRLKLLILKAAMNVGYFRPPPPPSPPPPSSTNTNTKIAIPLQTFVKSLPTNSFGSLPWQAALLAAYKKLVLSDPTFLNQAALPAPGKRASASEVGKSCQWMMRTGQYGFLRGLFRLVFGFHLDECEARGNVSITV